MNERATEAVKDGKKEEGSLMIRCLMLPLRTWGDTLPIPSK